MDAALMTRMKELEAENNRLKKMYAGDFKRELGKAEVKNAKSDFWDLMSAIRGQSGSKTAPMKTSEVDPTRTFERFSVLA